MPTVEMEQKKISHSNKSLIRRGANKIAAAVLVAGLSVTGPLFGQSISDKQLTYAPTIMRNEGNGFMMDVITTPNGSYVLPLPVKDSGMNERCYVPIINLNGNQADIFIRVIKDPPKDSSSLYNCGYSIPLNHTPIKEETSDKTIKTNLVPGEAITVNANIENGKLTISISNNKNKDSINSVYEDIGAPDFLHHQSFWIPSHGSRTVYKPPEKRDFVRVLRLYISI